MSRIVFIICFALFTFSCETETKDYRREAANPKYLHQSVKKLTDVIVHDIFSPPVASRIYAYTSIAAYEALLPEFPGHLSLAGQLNELEKAPQPLKTVEYCFPLASVQAFLSTGKALIFSEEKIESLEEEIYQEYKKMGVPEDVFNRSVEYGKQVSRHILDWAAKDNYKQTRTFPKYTINDEPFRWQPTPPAYMEAIEPHWDKIRPFAIDSAQQFSPVGHTPYDMHEGSDFYKEVMEVYETANNLSEEQTAIASFWDCNPYVSHIQGHVMFATKKITPGGHWMGIAHIAAKKSGADMMKTAEAYSLTSVALADGFITCWEEKFNSNLIRPESLINRHIDENWTPLLQTPPFPEYPSGHSVISTAAAVTLTHLFGNSFEFVDSTEIDYGLPPRTFQSFKLAAEEAAISRLYGGIHFMPAIKDGAVQGREIGNYVVSNINTREPAITDKGK